jgi:hypothetical protein
MFQYNPTTITTKNITTAAQISSTLPLSRIGKIILKPTLTTIMWHDDYKIPGCTR